MKNNKSILTVITIIMLAAIWIHSAMPAYASDAESWWALELVKPVLSVFVGAQNVTNHLVRKLAHFTEFFVLGAELFLMAQVCISGRKDRLLIAAGAGFVAAFIDETIQLFAIGRSAEIKDVWLDFFGVATAIVAGSVVWRVCRKRAGTLKNKDSQ